MLAENKQNIIKGKNEDTIAESLDNTAPFKSIIGAIEVKRRKEKTLSNYINCTVRRRHKPSDCFCFSDFLYPAQPRNAFTENWDGGLNSGFFEDFSHKSMMPWIITTANNIGKPDPLADTVKQRYHWNKKWTEFKISYNKQTKKPYKWFDDDVLYCPKIFTEMAEHLVNKPDPFFEDAYNWYYAGKGNMLVADLYKSDFIVFSQFSTVYISPFFKDTLSIDYANTATYECSNNANILETAHTLHIIALRTKYKVTILNVVKSEESREMKLDRLKEIDSELPFTSISFDECHKNILYVTTLDCQLTIINLDRMTARTKKLRGKFTTLADNWSCVIGAERGYYTHVTKKALTLYDKRINEPIQRWKNFAYVSDIESCGLVSAVKYCQRQPLLYVATDHYLFLMDMRYGKTKDSNIKPIQRWTHGMMSTPTYIDICNYDHNYNKEMVCLSSQWVEDMCLVSNYSDTLTRTREISRLNVPYRPPSIMQTFNEAQRNRLCCNLYEPIHHRLCTSISGMTIVNQGDKLAVLLQNSLGDISCHTLYPEHMFAFIQDDSTERLHEWSKDYREERKLFEVSHIVDIRMFLKSLYKVPDNYILGRNTVINPRRKFKETEIYESYAKEELDPEFLEIWKSQDAEITLDKTDMSQFFVED